jgi:hypothetical protein
MTAAVRLAWIVGDTWRTIPAHETWQGGNRSFLPFDIFQLHGLSVFPQATIVTLTPGDDKYATPPNAEIITSATARERHHNRKGSLLRLDVVNFNLGLTP